MCCLICIELLNHQLTLLEATKNAKEMVGDSEHVAELAEALEELDLEAIDKLTDEGVK